MRRRPYRSPSDPPISTSEVSSSMYASTIHWRAAPPAWSRSPINGRTTFTAVLSMKAIPDPRMVTANTQRPTPVGQGAGVPGALRMAAASQESRAYSIGTEAIVRRRRPYRKHKH